MQRFVSIGECMVEMAPAGPEGQFRLGYAGDTLNTAWYVRRLLPSGWQVEYLTAVGTDPISDRMLEFIAAAGIDTGNIARLPDRTVGLYLIELSNGERSFAYWRSQSAARKLADDPERLGSAIHGAAVIYLSGITLAILDGDGRDLLIAALAGARAAGAIVVFDPNLRPRLWSGVGAMRKAVMQAAGQADIVLPSHDDEASFFGDADIEATARRYAAAGAGLVVVKNGAGRIATLDAGELAFHDPLSVSEVVDSTAAGDSFNAGFLAAHLAGASRAEAVAAGCDIAARVIGARGALVEV
ncbi:2-keto-3-deoxygluconate kinase [Hoeflea marina]|uniref:2-keto-3-deoxygluconate kinase n=1 Tax=Hoeflea marina TaxID=274592 RepID=A0A317PL88_9HYPH|nr:2-keto-3-deoxygluconate kinase [Hoeflea marina]